MSLATPEDIRRLQRKLYLKAKAEPDFRFYQLYDKIYREVVLFHAYRLVRANQGAPGVDRQTFAMIEAAGLEECLSGLREELRIKTYKPQPLRRVMIPKPGGGGRPLGIPTIRDRRVVQTAAKLIIDPIPTSRNQYMRSFLLGAPEAKSTVPVGTLRFKAAAAFPWCHPRTMRHLSF